MMMTVFYRRHQIALLRAMGLTARRTYRVFLAQGVLIGTIGVSGGMLVGIAILLVLANYPIPLPQEIYYLGNVPVRFLWHDYLVIGMLAWLLESVVGGLSRRGSYKGSAEQGVTLSMSVVLQKVCKDYLVVAQRVQALKDINVTIAKGSRVAVTGKSGAGKEHLAARYRHA